MIHDYQLKRRRGYLLMVIFLFVFLILLVMSDILIYIFEYRYNPQIQSMDQSFVAVEAIFKLNTGEIYPITAGGRITAMVTLILSILLFLLFAVQAFTIFSTLGWRPKKQKKMLITNKKNNIKQQKIILNTKNEQELPIIEEDIYASDEKVMRKLEIIGHLKDQKPKK